MAPAFVMTAPVAAPRGSPPAATGRPRRPRSSVTRRKPPPPTQQPQPPTPDLFTTLIRPSLPHLTPDDLVDLRLAARLSTPTPLSLQTFLLLASPVFRADAPTLTAALLSSAPRDSLDLFHPDTHTLLADFAWLSALPASLPSLDDHAPNTPAALLREYVIRATQDPRALHLHLAHLLTLLRHDAALVTGACPPQLPPSTRGLLHPTPPPPPATDVGDLAGAHLRALEVLQVYAPLAHALGMAEAVREEIEDKAFRVLFPAAYRGVEGWHAGLA
eukprot:CAMPEP_0198313936 /NCGR_PEP_ID=MMETSP1450-20131203/4789_1 /TAXON_ID=753684 ORGANISM="Madagascaria erythrocladiodes, Strain CCMP3234" /NCGR_SAMPLE_ID=MMETSP1450 /ASSEMBLY_ACC=CAM_ASM_001115 /LENGTH=273 /DNA_ID=CAMNT_0044016967 /DNA_START=39 /DNA_END=856 /DNA_ORIENTATION=-